MALVTGRRALYYGGGMTAYMFVVVGLFGLVNFISYMNPKQLDLTASRKNSLSPQTARLVGRLPYELRVYAFVKDAENLRAAPRRLLQLYENAGDRFKWEFVDPDKKPGLAREYAVTQYNTFVLVGREGKKEAIADGLGEEKMTNAIIRIISTKEHAVYFAKGHGERDINDRDAAGYDEIRTALKNQNYKVGELELFLNAPVPENAAVIVLAGPQKDLLDSEKKKLDDFVRDGGRVLFLTGSFSANHAGPWLEKYGLRPDNDIIVDGASKLMGGNALAPMVTAYEEHPVTKDFRLMTFFPLACSVAPKSDAEHGVSTLGLAKTRPDTWGETDEAELKSGKVQFDQGKDFQGPLTIAAMSDVTTTAMDKEGKPKKGVVALVCDSEFASNAYLNVGGNKDLFMNIVNHLASEEDRVTISSRTADSEPLILTARQISGVAAASVAGLPLAVLFVGLWVTIRRRRSG
ncbi:MAG: GldG family protein [Nitrospinae bacterium]|nr:GldG family protein [Nitrospinota bacterium]